MLFAGLAVLHTWPLARAPWGLQFDNADSGHSAWTLAWIDHALVHDPLHVYDTNIFWPERNTLTYADPMFVPAIAAAPARLFGRSAALAENIVVLVGLVLSAWATWLVAMRWTGSSAAGLVAGALAAFNPHTLTRLPQAVAPWVWTLPLLLYFGDRLLERGSRRETIAVALLVLATAATSLYWLALAGVVVASVMVVGLVGRRWRRAMGVGLAAVGGLVLATPILWPYARVAATGMSRPLEMVMQFSATPAGYLSSLALVHRGWTHQFFRDDVDVFFVGFAALTLAAIGAGAAVLARGGQPEGRRRLAILTLVAVTGVLLSLGPSTGIYRWLYDWFLPLRGLRVVARFGYLYLLAVGLAAGYGIAWIAARRPGRTAAIATAALGLVTLEVWQGPVAMHAWTGVPPIYEVVRDLPDPVRLVEVPFFPPDAMHENAEYIVDSTTHWRPILNGYSGFTPDSYRKRTESIWFFPEPWAIDAIRSSGATYLMVHLERFGDQAADVRRALLEPAGLQLIASDALGHRLYRVLTPGRIVR